MTFSVETNWGNAMSKQKTTTKDKEKGGQLVIRVDKSERATFIALCEELDTTAAREIRRFMREFVTSRASDVALVASGDAADNPPVRAEVTAFGETLERTPDPEEKASSSEVAADEAEKLKKTRKRVKS